MVAERAWSALSQRSNIIAALAALLIAGMAAAVDATAEEKRGPSKWDGSAATWNEWRFEMPNWGPPT